MKGHFTTAALVAATVGGLFAAPVHADDAADIEALRAQLERQQSEINALRQSQNTSDADWLDERRQAEVKSLIEEVLADSASRTSFQDGMYAGISDKGKIFLSSADGNYTVEFGGQIQVRYIFNFNDGREDATGGDLEDLESGFQIRRTKVSLAGNIFNPKFGYELTFAVDRGDGNVELEDVILTYEFVENLEVALGHFKIPFLREELTSSKRQIAIDRGLSTEYFTLDRSEQVQINYSGDGPLHAAVSINDGADEGFTDVFSDTVQFGVTGRVDYKIAGDWNQWKDITSWKDESFAAFIGGAAHYQEPKDDADDSYFAWTVDGSIENAGLSVYGAFMSGHIDDRDAFGILAQAGYHITDQIEPFARWDYIDGDDGGDALQAFTVGGNYYFAKHNLKLTGDVVWIYEGDNPSALGPANSGELSSGLGLNSSGFSEAEDQIAVRTQLQLLF